jgi:hypothetical protein
VQSLLPADVIAVDWPIDGDGHRVVPIEIAKPNDGRNRRCGSVFIQQQLASAMNWLAQPVTQEDIRERDSSSSFALDEAAFDQGVQGSFDGRVGTQTIAAPKVLR